MAQTKEYRQDSLTGGMDTRNPNGSVSPDSYRLIVNMDGSDGRPFCRLPGFIKYDGSGDDNDCYNNRDLHDQMLGGQQYKAVVTTSAGQGCSDNISVSLRQSREPISFLKSISSPSGRRRLMAGTRSRLYINDDRNGNWRIIADQLGGVCYTPSAGCEQTRMRSATLGSATVLTNNVDPVMVWEFDAGVEGCSMWSADYMRELLEVGISAAEFVTEFQGFVFIGNVIADGFRVRNRIYWSDFNDPTSWIPGGESLAAFTDFGASEEIVGLLPIGGKLRVYTDKAIYDGSLVADTQLATAGLVFAFQEIYRGTAVPKYKNTLINAGGTHYFLGEDTIYRMAEYDTEPTEFQWISNASGVIYNGLAGEWVHQVDSIEPKPSINKDACENAVAGYREADNSVWFSWPTEDGDCPSLTLILWPTHGKSTVVTHGFTAFCEHTPDTSPTMRDFLGQIGLCDPADSLDVKEGAPCPSEYTENPTFEYLWNETEDPDLPMGEYAVLKEMCGLCLEDICRSCDADTKFLAPSSTDYCLKEFSKDAYYWEILLTQTPATFPNTGLAFYEQHPYTSLIMSDMANIKTSVEKTARGMKVGYVAADQDPPALLNCHVAGGEDADCVQWEVCQPEPMACQSATSGYRPQSYARFGCYTTGVYLGWRLFVEGVGGQFCLNSLAFRVIHDQRKW